MSLNRLRFLIASVLLTLVLASCAGAATPVADQAAPVKPTAAPAVAATDTPLPAPTATAEPRSSPPRSLRQPPSLRRRKARPGRPHRSTGPRAFHRRNSGGRVLRCSHSCRRSDPRHRPRAGLQRQPAARRGRGVLAHNSNGVYDHPGDQGTNSRDRGFQFYGTWNTASTVAIPSAPCGRATTSHDPNTSTSRSSSTVARRSTQFYFEEDRANLGVKACSRRPVARAALILISTDSVEMNGAPVAVLTNDLVIDTGSPGSLPATPLQTEGPYYPVVAVAGLRQ